MMTLLFLTIKSSFKTAFTWMSIQGQCHSSTSGLCSLNKLNVRAELQTLSPADWCQVHCLPIVRPSDDLQFILLHSEFHLQSGLSALDGRANAERAAAGHGPCRLFQPWSCHRLLSGCCPDPSRTLVRLAVS